MCHTLERMPRARYSLEPLVRLRRDRVDEATAALATSLAERQRAEADVARAEGHVELHAGAAVRTRATEHEALARGERTAADLQRSLHWEIGVKVEGTTREQHAAEARERSAAATSVASSAQARLSTKMAEESAVLKHRASFVQAEDRRAAAEDEQAAEEAWRPRRA